MEQNTTKRIAKNTLMLYFRQILIMLTNVNGRKLAYAITPDGISELTERGRKFARRTFAIVNEYNDILFDVISNAKAAGKKSVVLYGDSYIRFLIAYVCMTLDLEFKKKNLTTEIDVDSFCLVGELEENKDIEKMTDLGCYSLIDVVSIKEFL